MTAHFEAKKHAYRQTQDGVVISFVVHPNDVNTEIAMAALGTRFMVAIAEIGDDEKPVAPVAQQEEQPACGRETLVQVQPGSPKSKRRFDELPLSQQCAMTCEDRRFADYIGVSEHGNPAAQWVREYCAVESRAELDKDARAAGVWRILYDGFQQYLIDLQFAGSVR